jgi:hypothetical protein
MLGERPFVLPGPIGWIANLVSISFCWQHCCPESYTC